MATEKKRMATGDEQRVLAFWKDGLTSIDPRYDTKALLKLGGVAMLDREFRTKLLNETEETLGYFTAYPLPKGLTLKFYENTADTLHVVLPPFGGGLNERTPEFREALRSRTSGALFLARDDFDMGDWSDWSGNSVGPDHGDEGPRDEPSVLA
jgi:hypothetical protein